MENLGVHKCSNHTQKITGYKKGHSAWQRDDKLQVDHLTQRNPQKRWERLESLLEFGQLSQAGTSNRAAEEDLHLLSYLKLYEEKVRVSDSGGQSLWFRPSFLWCGIRYCMSFQLQPNTVCMRVREATSLLLCLLKTRRHISNSSTRRTPEVATSAHMQAFPPGRCKKKKKKMERSPRLSVVRKSILTLSFCRRRLRVSSVIAHESPR